MVCDPMDWDSGAYIREATLGVLHSGGYSDDELRQFRWIIHRNTLEYLKAHHSPESETAEVKALIGRYVVSSLLAAVSSTRVAADRARDSRLR